jgi:hypothetical protein
MKTYLAIPVEIIPDWTKQNVPTYPLGRFSNDGAYMLIDNAHPISTYERWLGPNIGLLDSIIAASEVLTHDEIIALSNDPQSIWFGGA